MPPRRIIEREAIIKEAFGIVRKSGWGTLTARNLAKNLRTSTMPLYSTLGSMDDIKNEIRKMSAAMMHEYQRGKYTSDDLLNGAVGYVTFANDEKELFKFLFMETGQYEAATGNWSDLDISIPFDRKIVMKRLLPDLSDELIKR